MKPTRGASRVIIYECAGFGLILLLSILNNLVGLPHLLVGGDDGVVSRWRFGVMETVIILLIWAFVFSITRRLLRRLHDLEGMLRVCAWCHKVGHEDKWMRLEDYLSEGLQIDTTHGICPECLKKVEDGTRQISRRETLASTQGKVTEGAPRATA